MFEQMAAEKAGGRNKNMCVRPESPEFHLFFISSGIPAWRLMGKEAHAHGPKTVRWRHGMFSLSTVWSRSALCGVYVNRPEIDLSFLNGSNIILF